jgi:hypothetical protein
MNNTVRPLAQGQEVPAGVPVAGHHALHAVQYPLQKDAIAASQLLLAP